MAQRRLKVTMVGVAGFGAHRRLRMRQTGLFDVIAVYDRDPQALSRAAAEEGAAAADSFESLLKTPGAEALIISTGASYHAEQTIAALERGLHVFVEKPLASTMDEVRAVLDAQRRTGRVVGCGHHDHSADAFSRTVKRPIDSGELGTIVTFEATTAHSGGYMIKPGDWRGSRKHNPGGMLFQCGVHKLHELIFYFGPVRRIHAVMRYDVHDTETADAAICQVEFYSGVIGTLNAYHVTPCLQSLMIAGTKAAVFRDERPWDGEKGQWIQRIPSAMDGSIERREPLPIDSDGDDAGNLRNFHRAVTEGGVPYPSAVDGARALMPVFLAARSDEGACWFDVGDPDS